MSCPLFPFLYNIRSILELEGSDMTLGVEFGHTMAYVGTPFQILCHFNSILLWFRRKIFFIHFSIDLFAIRNIPLPLQTFMPVNSHRLLMDG